MDTPLADDRLEPVHARAGETMEVGEKTAGILLSETDDVIPRQASLIERLPPEARERIKAFGRSRTYHRGDAILTQGAAHDGIFLLDRGLIRSFYTAPSGREITLAYWLPGNFVGG